MSLDELSIKMMSFNVYMNKLGNYEYNSLFVDLCYGTWY